MIIDLHADTPLLMNFAQYDFCRRHRPWLPMGAWFSHVDLPRMQEANMDAQVFGLVALPGDSDPYGTLNAMIDRFEKAAAQSAGEFILARSGTELVNARAQNKRVGLLSVEGVHALRGSLERAQALIERGVMSFGLAHFHANEACRPSVGLRRNDAFGLTHFGEELVNLFSEQRILLDLTHINRAGFFHALNVCQGPVFVSHSGVRGAYQHWRNLDDEQIRAIAERGGIVGIIFSRHFLGGNTIEAVVRHIRHLIDVGGEECAALGSDFDGFIVPVRGLRDVTGLVALRDALQRAGFSSTAVDRIMGRNALALLHRVGRANVSLN